MGFAILNVFQKIFVVDIKRIVCYANKNRKGFGDDYENFKKFDYVFQQSQHKV